MKNELSEETEMNQNPKDLAESNAEFIARMNPTGIRHPGTVTLTGPDYDRLIALAKERVMIEEHRLAINYQYNKNGEQFWVESEESEYISADISTAIRAVVAKIGEGND